MARRAITVRLTIPPLTEWQARVTRAWLGPVAASWWVHHFGPKQLERHAYPGQASQRAVRVPPRCLCAYERPSPLDLFGAPHFRIRRACPHHGDAARE